MTYNPEIHHRRTIRLKGYDYATDGAYFVTLCTFQRENLFGEIFIPVGAGSKPALTMNEIGKMVDITWHDLPNHNHNVSLDAFVIMPNHIHGIIVIENGARVGPDAGRETRAGLEPAPTLSEIVRQLKTFSAKRINQLRDNPGCPVWQRNYYERVLRNDNELSRAREYIANNPLKWGDDDNNPATAL